MESRSSLAARFVLILAIMLYLANAWWGRSHTFADFNLLHFGSSLVADGRAAEAYDSPTFRSLAEAEPNMADQIGELSVFWSTPVFAFFMRPFTLLTPTAAALTWTVLGVVALLAAVRVLRLPMWSAGIALLFPASIANAWIGQTGFFVALWAAVVHRLSTDGRQNLAGFVAGFAVVKPTVALGLLLWWALDIRRWYRAATVATLTGLGIVGLTMIGGMENWRLFVSAVNNRTDAGLQVSQNQPTLREFVNRLFSTDIAGHPLALGLYIAIGAVILLLALRRWPGDVELVSATAVFVSILVSPHMVIYDTVLVLMLIAVAVHRGSTAKTVEPMLAVLAGGAMLMRLGGGLAFVNDVVNPATVSLVMFGILWARSVSRPDADVESIASEREQRMAA